MSGGGILDISWFGIPGALWALVLLFVWIIVLFVALKRPIYEVMATAFIFCLGLTNSWDGTIDYLLFPSRSDLFFLIASFLALGHFFSKARVIDRVMLVVLAAAGRFRGGGGYVSLGASTFMAALSGTGPGNVVATGIFTIPTMIRTGFPRSLAATVEMAASSLGNIIPPSGIVILAYGLLNETFPSDLSLGDFLLIAYGIGAWFFLQRWLLLVALCRYHGVEPVPKEELPELGKALRENWDALILPVLIVVPIIADVMLGTFASDWYTNRLGPEGRVAFSRGVLLISPGLAAAYVHFTSSWRNEKRRNASELLEIFRSSLQTVVPVSATIYFAYAIAIVFKDASMAEPIRDWVVQLGLSKTAIIIVMPIFFAMLGMILPGSSQIAILGGAMLASFASLGGDPRLFAALLPAMTGAMEGMTPPLALCMFGAMGIAKSGFLETSLLAYLWIFFHLLLSMLLLAGWLPVFGLG